MPDAPRRKILVVGGGIAGWTSALTLSRLLAPHMFAIQILDQPPPAADLESLDGGESSLPVIAEFHAALGLSDPLLVRETSAGFSLGTAFENFPRQGVRAFRPHGEIGARLDGISFHHYWLRARAAGDAAALSDYAIAAVAAQRNRFAPPAPDRRSVLSALDYAHHLSGPLYQALLRAHAEQAGAVRVEGELAAVELRGTDGFIEAVTLKDGRRLGADIFIDCSGAHGALIEGALKSGFVDWRHWLPCDRALASRTASTQAPAPFRTACAGVAGWIWTIPLQGSVGHGHVYASTFLSDDKAAHDLNGEADVRLARFSSGRRTMPWVKNCVAIGSAACVLDPLEPSALYILQKGLLTFLQLMPHASWAASEAGEYNRIMIETVERLRDFTALRYLGGARADTPFWVAVREATPPDSFAYKRDLFAASGRVFLAEHETLSEADWAAAWLSQEIFPRAHSPLADAPDLDVVRKQLERIRGAIATAVDAMPTHSIFIRHVLANTKMQT